MSSLLRACLLGLALLAAAPGPGQAQSVVFFDEAVGAAYAASRGATTGGDSLALIEGRLPLTTERAWQGTVAGMLTYRHTDGGTWRLEIGAEGFAPQDVQAADSLVLYLNAPLPVAGRDLPAVRLLDAAGRTTAPRLLDLPGRIGFNSVRSGFEEGSPTDARFFARYQPFLPPDAARPGYPEDLRITFFDEVVDTSRTAIGVPAQPIRYRVETLDGTALTTRFLDTDANGTLNADGEYIEILTPEAEGSTRLRPTWRVTVSGTPPTRPPASGDVYRLAVDNDGLDADPTTWQRLGLSLQDFGPLGALDLTQVEAVVLENGTATTGLRTLWVDGIAAVDNDPATTGPPPPTDVTLTPGRESVVLTWTPVPDASRYVVYRQAGPEAPFERVHEDRLNTPQLADLGVEDGTAYTYIVRSVSADGLQGPDGPPHTTTPRADLPDAFMELQARLAFDFFWLEANPENGLIRDRTNNERVSSIASVGFGLSAYTVGIDRGWISREAGLERVLNTLRFFWTAPQGPGDGTTGHRGFFYHFLDMNTGLRNGTSELSTIDTALLLGGVLHMRQYFDGADAAETEVRALADSIYHRVDWPWAAPNAPLVSLGWRPESGFIPFDWRGYNESMILYILALGSPTFPLPPSAWDGWTSTYRFETHYGFEFVPFPPLFGHQYSHLWVDFRGIQDDYMRARGLDYFENSRRATLAQRAYHIDNPRNHPNYGPNEWGLTASDIPTGYIARGAPPAQNDNGTIAPTAPGGSYPFTPEESRAALRHFYQQYRPTLWGPYGLRDAYSVRDDWFATTYLGIDQGPILLMYENHVSGAIWSRVMQDEAIQRGLERAGFRPVTTAREPVPDQPSSLQVTSLYPQPAAKRATLTLDLPAPASVQVTVYDLLGRRLATVLDAPRPAGASQVPIDTAAWAPGLYLVRITAGEASQTARLLVGPR